MTSVLHLIRLELARKPGKPVHTFRVTRLQAL